MEKVLLAVGHRQLEEYIKSQLRKEYQFVGEMVHRDGIVRAVGQKKPNIVVIRETLEGRENILTVIYDLRTKYPRTRIIFIAGNREPGDALLANLVSYGVYDILYGEKIQANEVIRLIRNANEYNDVQHLQPKPVLDEKSNKVFFKAPDVLEKEKEIVKEVIKEVYLDNEPASKSRKSNNDEDDPAYKEELEHVSQEIAEKIITLSQQSEDMQEDDYQEEEKRRKFSVFNSEKKQAKDEKKNSFGLFQRQNIAMGGKERIFSFMGAKSGVGNTSIAFNFAIYLAQKKNRVIYIEMNDRNPAVAYWYDVGLVKEGIDKALIGLENNRFDGIEDGIIHSSALKLLEEADLKRTYEKFPSTLDIMLYSNDYLIRNEEIPLQKSLTKDLYLYLLFQLKYDYVILDIHPNIWEEDTLNALLYSNKVFITLTQDVSVIGNSVYILNELRKKGINISRKSHYIVNKFEKAELTAKDIQDWIEADELITIPNLNREFINANFIGMPILLTQRNTQIKTAMRNLEKKI